MFKKVCFGLITLYFSFITQIVLGANVNVIVSSVSAPAGSSKVSVPIMISDVSGLGLMSSNFTMNYDNTKLVFSTITAVGTITESWNEPVYNPNTSGKILIVMYGSHPIKGSGKFLTAYFNVKPKATAGKSNLTISNIEFNSGNTAAGDTITTTIQNGQFTILTSTYK